MPEVQAVTKCGHAATPWRGTKYFARHKMVNVKDKKIAFFYWEQEILRVHGRLVSLHEVKCLFVCSYVFL